MGSYMSCLSSAPTPETTYDMTTIRNKNLPFIWITGPPNSGKKTIGRLIKNKYEFEHINITDLLRQEASKDTKTALIVKKHLNANRKVPDNIVIDLLKEALINSTNDKGFLISNFPKTMRQAEVFTKDIANVNFVFYLYTGFPLLIDRAQRRSSVPLDNDILRRNIAISTREIKACLGKFAVKIESINTNGCPEETFMKVESAMVRRINIARPIIAETDYVQVQQIQPNTPQSTTPFTENNPLMDYKSRKDDINNDGEDMWEDVILSAKTEKPMSENQNIEERMQVKDNTENKEDGQEIAQDEQNKGAKSDHQQNKEDSSILKESIKEISGNNENKEEENQTHSKEESGVKKNNDNEEKDIKMSNLNQDNLTVENIIPYSGN